MTLLIYLRLHSPSTKEAEVTYTLTPLSLHRHSKWTLQLCLQGTLCTLTLLTILLTSRQRLCITFDILKKTTNYNRA